MTRGRRLLDGIVDYAGLFPPTAWPMADAVREYDLQRRADAAWMLASFVVPVARLEEWEAERIEQDVKGAWPISALLGADPIADAEALLAFLAARDHVASLAAVEFEPRTHSQVERVRTILQGRGEVFCELAWDDDLDDWMPVLRAQGAKAKIRTGGVTADLIPPVEAVARFLRACQAGGVGMKFTAGLHHPVRAEQNLTYDPQPPRAVMHGFLNCFVAAALVATDDVDDDTLLAVLGETDPGAFTLDDDGGVRWRDRHVTADAARRAREGFARSFGSCSFAEPVEDLQTLDLT